MLTDTKQEIIRGAIDELREAEDALNVTLGRLPALELNNLLYGVLTDLRAGIEVLQYIDRRMGGQE